MQRRWLWRLPGLLLGLAMIVNLASCARAVRAADAPKPIEEVDALRIKTLELERRWLDAERRAGAAEGHLRTLSKAAQLDEALKKMAEKYGVKLEEFHPDVDARAWVAVPKKDEPKKEPTK